MQTNNLLKIDSTSSLVLKYAKSSTYSPKYNGDLPGMSLPVNKQGELGEFVKPIEKKNKEIFLYQ